MLRLNNLPSSPSSSSSSSPSPPPSKRPRLRPPPHTSADSPSSFRIFSWNCDNISDYLPPPKVSNPIHNYFSRVSPPAIRKVASPSSKWSIRGILKERNWPEFFCLQEVKILENDKTLIARARNAALPDNDDNDDNDDGGPGYVMYYTLPVVAKRAAQNKRMYGVITYVRADFAEHVKLARGVDWDDEGRILILEMSSMAVINVYAVNGTDAPYVPRSTGESTGQTRHQRKRQFNHLLLQECLRLHSRGLEICLLGDINISRYKIDSVPRLRPAPDHVLTRKELNEIFLPQTGLVDAWRESHGPIAQGYTWFNPYKEPGTDCARVDMILCSRGLYERMAEVEIEKWGGQESKSDHAIMWIRIDGFDLNLGTERGDLRTAKQPTAAA